MPGSLATKAPSGSTAPPPGLTRNSGITSGTGLPAEVRALTRSRTTSPVRTAVSPGVSARAAVWFASTTSGIAWLARPARAVTVARPARTAVMRPAGVTDTTPGASDSQAIGS